MNDPYDIHAIARGKDPFQTCRIVLEECKNPDAAKCVAQAEETVITMFCRQFDSPPTKTIAWATEGP